MAPCGALIARVRKNDRTPRWNFTVSRSTGGPLPSMQANAPPTRLCAPQSVVS
jgi:hypothetical protein